MSTWLLEHCIIVQCTVSPEHFSCGRCNESPQSGGLKKAEISVFTVLEASRKSVSLGQNEGVRRAILPPEALGEDFVPFVLQLWWLLAATLQSLLP